MGDGPGPVSATTMLLFVTLNALFNWAESAWPPQAIAKADAKIVPAASNFLSDGNLILEKTPDG